MCRSAIVCVLVGSKSISRAAKDSLGFGSMGAHDCKNRCPKFEYVFHEGDEAVVRRVMGIVCFRFIYELGAAGAPIWGDVSYI